MSRLLDGNNRAILSHQCPTVMPIPYTEDRRDMSHLRVPPALLEGRDKGSPFRGVPVSHFLVGVDRAEHLLAAAAVDDDYLDAGPSDPSSYLFHTRATRTTVWPSSVKTMELARS